MTLPILQEQGGALSGLVKGLGMGLQQTIPSIQEMIVNRQKQKMASEAIQKILPQGSEAGNLNWQHLLALHQAGQGDLAKTLAPVVQSQEKQQLAQQEEAQEKALGQDSFNRMAEILKKGNLGLGSKLTGKVFGGKVAEDVGEFESLSGALESMLVDRVSRGTLSNTRFKYITETLLPKPNDRKATIKGKLKALARELDLDPSALMKMHKNSGEVGIDFVFMETPEGKTVKVPRDKIAQAQKAGGKVKS